MWLWLLCGWFGWLVAGLWMICEWFGWFVDSLAGLWVVRLICGWFRVLQLASVKKVFLKMSQNSQENTCARISFLITLLKKRLWQRCFPVNFAKYLRTPFFIEHLWWLLLLLFYWNEVNKKLWKRRRKIHSARWNIVKLKTWLRIFLREVIGYRASYQYVRQK